MTASARLFGIDDALDTDAWYTPPWIFEGLGLTFDLDVAAPAERLSWIPARKCYTVADDGLSLPWHGLVWCNPPYSAPTDWARRWAEHGNGCILLRADLSVSGPRIAFDAATSMYVARRRIQFVNGRGGSTGSVNFSSVLFGVGDTADAGLLRLAHTKGGHTRLLTRSGPSSDVAAAPEPLRRGLPSGASTTGANDG